MNATGDPLLAFLLLVALVAGVVLLELPRVDPDASRPFGGRAADDQERGRHW